MLPSQDPFLELLEARRKIVERSTHKVHEEVIHSVSFQPKDGVVSEDRLVVQNWTDLDEVGSRWTFLAVFDGVYVWDLGFFC